MREDYSAHGDAWRYFPHEHARFRAYRWNEDGLGGICDRHQRICFALALWNGRDPFLKERLFGLGGHEGNHGEDVKEYYFYADSAPTHSYMKFVYKYPQARFPYEQLVEENRRRGRSAPEFELHDTGVFADDRYFDVIVQYAKNDPEDIFVEITVVNRGPDPAVIHVLPTVWFRNTWSWSHEVERPRLWALRRSPEDLAIQLDEPMYGSRWFYSDGSPALLFTENETNQAMVFGASGARYAKDAINAAVVERRPDAVNAEQFGTKAAAHHLALIEPGGRRRFRGRLTNRPPALAGDGGFGDEADGLFKRRAAECDAFYRTVIPPDATADEASVVRQACAGLLWSKQFYHYDVGTWLDGDAAQPPPPASRKTGRNAAWRHVYCADVLSMPDTWEYPWFAAWDLAFHCIPLALVDADFAKDQLTLLLREWYMHPNGALPAYEWDFGDVNPPIHAWAAWRVYKIDKRRTGTGDRVFLERVFQKLLLTFTWWVNRKDRDGRNVFEGGFLGLDNIGVFDRNQQLPAGGRLAQSDATSWMAMFSLNMLAMALELSDGSAAYEDMASKFWEHFLYIARAMHQTSAGEDVSMWNEAEGLFFDVLRQPSGQLVPIKIRSAVGLIPLFAVETLEPSKLTRLKDFKRRLEWFVRSRGDLTANVASMSAPGTGERRLLSIVNPQQLRRVLHAMLDEREFLSPYGIRSLSKVHERRPYALELANVRHQIGYEPGESRGDMLGGNSNWRGPVWFPINFLIIESLQKFHHYLGDGFRVECPTGSGCLMTLSEVAAELSRRLSAIFLKDGEGRRPVNGNVTLFDGPAWSDYVPFAEYFDGDTGRGLGASHQTGWTALIAKLIIQMRDAARQGGDITMVLS